MWDADKFQNRIIMMRDLLNQFFETGEVPEVDQDHDPFWDPAEALHIGTSHLQLKNLGYMLPNELDSKILSSEGAQGQNGILRVQYTPCAENGIDEPEDDVQCDEPHELVGKECWFRVEIDQAMNLPAELCQDTYVTYSFKHEPNVQYKTDSVPGMNQNPKYSYSKVHHIPSVTDYIIDYIDSGSINFKVYGYPKLKAGTGIDRSKPKNTAKVVSGGSKSPKAQPKPSPKAKVVEKTTIKTETNTVETSKGSSCCTIF